MDYKKIGQFIASERKSKKLTQSQLAAELYVSEKTISKWENGNGIPSTDVLPKLCEIFNVSINEILNGERIPNKDYAPKAEESLLQLKHDKEERDKLLLMLEIFWGICATAIFIGLVCMASTISITTWLKIVLYVTGLLQFLIFIAFALKIEQKAGYYECAKCHHQYIPTFSQIFWAMHIGRTRYMKCPHCKHKSWNKKTM